MLHCIPPQPLERACALELRSTLEAVLELVASTSSFLMWKQHAQFKENTHLDLVLQDLILPVGMQSTAGIDSARWR